MKEHNCTTFLVLGLIEVSKRQYLGKLRKILERRDSKNWIEIRGEKSKMFINN